MIGLGRAERAPLDVLDRLDRRAVDGDEHIARPNAGRHRTAAGCNIGGGDPFRPRFPEHAVLELVRRGAHGDIQRAKAQQDPNQGEEPPACQRTPLRSMGLVLHWITAMWGTPLRLQTLYPYRTTLKCHNRLFTVVYRRDETEKSILMDKKIHKFEFYS